MLDSNMWKNPNFSKLQEMFPASYLKAIFNNTSDKANCSRTATLLIQAFFLFTGLLSKKSMFKFGYAQSN